MFVNGSKIFNSTLSEITLSSTNLWWAIGSARFPENRKCTEHGAIRPAIVYVSMGQGHNEKLPVPAGGTGRK